MLEKNKQEVSDINNAVVQQANGNINNYGLGYNDVKAICHDVIRQELTMITKEASEVFKDEIDSFLKFFIEKLEQLNNPRLIERLKKPKLQFILHFTMKEYATSYNTETKEELIDLLIERLRVDENSLEMFLIETAIEILPKITKNQCYFLGALALRLQNVDNTISNPIIARNYLKKQAQLYEGLDRITNLDIQYLKQINCCTTLIGQSPYYDILRNQKKEYDLLFRHPCTLEKYQNYIDYYNSSRQQTEEDFKKRLQELKNKVIKYETLYKGYEKYRKKGIKDIDYEKHYDEETKELKGVDRLYDSVERQYEDFLRNYIKNLSTDSFPFVHKDNNSNNIYLNLCSTKNLESVYNKSIPYNKYKEFINDLFPPFKNYDIEQFLISLNKNWKKAFGFFKKPDILNIELTPIGTYIGGRIISKVAKISSPSIINYYNK